MASEQYNTWNPALYFEVCHGAFSGKFLRSRTIAFTYTDRDRKYDEISWELDNHDGVLTAVEYLALGLTIRVRLGYLNATTPWKYFVIDKVKGPVGVRDKTNTRGAIATRKPGRGDARLVYHGRNRNAPIPKNPKKSKFAKPSSYLVKAELFATHTIRRPRVILGSTTADIARELARRNGFTGPYATIEPTNDHIGSRTIPEGKTDGAFLKELAEEEGFIFKVDKHGLHFHSTEYGGGALRRKQLHTFVYGAGPDILDLSVDGDFRLPTPGKVTIKGYDPQRRTGVVKHADGAAHGVPDQVAAGIIKNLGPAGHILGDAQHIRNLAMHQQRIDALIATEDIATVPNIVAMASNKARRRFENKHLRSYKIRLKVVGNPSVLARDDVRITGGGSRLVDGKWYVSEAKHVFSGETYVTDLLLRLPPKQKQKQNTKQAISLKNTKAQRTGGLNPSVSAGVISGLTKGGLGAGFPTAQPVKSVTEAVTPGAQLRTLESRL